MASKLNQEMAEQWKATRQAAVKDLMDKALELGLEEQAVQDLLQKGITRAFDEALATADKKEAVLNKQAELPSLPELADKSRQSQKELLIQELVAAGYPMNKDMLQKLSGKELAQVKAQFMG